MRFTIIILTIMTSVAAFADGVDDWAKAEIVGTYEHGTVLSFGLSDAQVLAAIQAKGEDVEIELTEDQILAIKEATGLKNVRKTVTLNSTDLRPGNKAVLSFKNVEALDSLYEVIE